MRFHHPIRPGASVRTRARFLAISPKSSGTVLSYHLQVHSVDDILLNDQYMKTFLPGVSWPREEGEAPASEPIPMAVRGAPTVARLSQRFDADQTFRYAAASGDSSRWHVDDEAAVLFGNVLHWQMDPLSRQSPALASTHPKLARRVKPLYRLSERETAAYAFLRGIDYIVDECPFAKGATSIAHKQILDRLEEASPGAKHNFLFGFLEKARAAFERVDGVELHECARCGQVTTSTVCAFCKLSDQVKRARV